MSGAGQWMGEAIELARAAAALGEVPVGAIVVGPDGAVLARAHNRRDLDADPVAHAELLALREAARTLGDWRLAGCTLVVSLEPCTMCAGAAVLARIKELVFGAWDPKAGACGSLRDVVRDPRLNHRMAVRAGVREQECGAMLSDFFARARSGPGS